MSGIIQIFRVVSGIFEFSMRDCGIYHFFVRDCGIFAFFMRDCGIRNPPRPPSKSKMKGLLILLAIVSIDQFIN